MRFTSLFVTACAVSLVLLMLMPTVSAVEIIVNASHNSMVASDEDANWSTMIKAPDAAFSGTPTSGPKPLTVTFTDKSKGSITSRLWEYKLHSGSTWTTFTLDEASKFSFTNAGIYDVRLTVTGVGGSNTKTESNYITVNEAAPVAAFSGTPSLSGPKPLTVSFTDSSTGIISSYSWIFGDGNTSTAQNPSHTYSTVGSYTVTLSVIGPGGSDLESKTNYITVTNATTWIGIYKDGVWNLDLYGNGGKGAGTDKLDYFGSPDWTSVVGDWNGDGNGIKIGIYKDGTWYLDMNGNGAWDGPETDRLVTSFGLPGWTAVVGDWNGNGKTKIGVCKNGVWYLDWNGNGVWDAGFDKEYYFGATGWTAVVGDWNGDGKGTKIGVYKDGVWYLDWNGSGAWNAGIDKEYYFGASGWTTVVGDWNGNGKTKIGVYKDGLWYLDYNGDGVFSSGVNTAYTFRGEAGWTPVVGDWNGNGTTKIGVYKDGDWYLDYNGNGIWDSGDKECHIPTQTYTTPIVGDWNGDGKTKLGYYRWGFWSLDYLGEGIYSKYYTFLGSPPYDFTPVVGDWNGNKTSKIGVYKYTTGDWYLDYDGNGGWDATADKRYNLGGSGWITVVGDWNGDGKSKTGVFKDGVWRLDYNGDGSVIKEYIFGTTGSTPIIGNWNGDGKGTRIGVYKDGVWYLDWNGSGAWNADTDKEYYFGATGWIPVVGKWS